MKPRLTKKVIRGLVVLRQAVDKTELGLDENESSDLAVAWRWIEDIAAWAGKPRRKGPIPLQLRKVMRQRFTRRGK